MTTQNLIEATAPEHLSPTARKCYEAIAAELGNLKKLHQPEAEMAAEAYSTWQSLSRAKAAQEEKDVEKTYIYMTSNGNQAVTTLVKQMTEARDCYIALLEKLRIAAAAPPEHPDFFRG